MKRPLINKPKRILISGDRNWTDKARLRAVLQQHLNPAIDIIIHGDARGADRLGAEVAKELGVPEERIWAFPADWNRYHKAAGPIRNRQMLTEGKPDLVLAFHDDIEKSKGTRDMVKIALKAEVPVHLNGLRITSLPST